MSTPGGIEASGTPADRLAALDLPLFAAPMFLVSGPDLVIAACRSGVVGSFPALNLRSSAEYQRWLERIRVALDQPPGPTDRVIAPYAVNLIVHASNPRLAADLEITARHGVPVVITSLGAVADVVQTVKSYGGIVLHDVTSARHAEKALKAGVDGLIAVSAGAGGHAGTVHPFALLSELRELRPGILVLAGAISHGREIAGAIAAGADYAYMGTRFIATRESLAPDAYKAMLLDSRASDIVYTPKISGIHANFIARSITDNGLDLHKMQHEGVVNIGEELIAATRTDKELQHKSLAWKHIWSAGQGVGSIHDIPAVAELCARLRSEYQVAAARLARRTGLLVSPGSEAAAN